MHRNKNRSSKCEQNSEAFCCNPNNLVFLCKTRSLTIRVIKKHVFWLNVELVQKFGNLSGCVYCRPFLWVLWASLPGRLPFGDFDLSFLIQGAGRHDFQWRPLLHWDHLRHSAKNRAIGIRRTFVTSDSIYLIIYGILALNRFCIITEWRFIRRNRWAARPLGKDSVSEMGNSSKYPVRRSFVSPHAFERLAIKANPNFSNLIRQSSDWFF